MLRILSSKLLLAKTLRPLTYFSTKKSSNTSSSSNKEIKMPKESINKEPKKYTGLKAKKGTDPVIRPKIILRDRTKKQKRKALVDMIEDSPEFMQDAPGARKSVSPTEDMIDYRFDIHPVKSVGKYDYSGEYFDSLGYKRKGIVAKHIHERIRENEMQFVDAYLKPDTPAKCLMTEQEKEVIHLEIDKRMQELEDTGLSRHEILNRPKGKTHNLPLKDDPLFQLIKENRTVRELLITPHEEFSSDNVIRKALEQNSGPDPSLDNSHSRYLLKGHVPDNKQSKYSLSSLID